jgi:ubiquinone/menaquinone biosynthesis C-methylase UbiE
MNKYVHGYSQRETIRLTDQANTLEELLHHDTIFPEGSNVLEAGCGTGAQTVIIARKNPLSHFISIDISPESISEAETKVQSYGISNVQFQQNDIFNLSFPDEFFDHIFLCFVLEHLSNPLLALSKLKRVLKKKGGLTVIEGDHGSAYFHPDSEDAQRVIHHLVDLQKQKGGDANIGRRLYPLLQKAGLKNISVSPRQVYADDSKPGMMDGFTKKTFTAMIEGIREDALKNGLTDEMNFDKGIEDLYRTAMQDGTFCYTFFKATGIKPD